MCGKLCVERKREAKEQTKQTKINNDEFDEVFFSNHNVVLFFLQCQFITLAKFSRHAWIPFRANIS